jgi:hypothetical protein
MAGATKRCPRCERDLALDEFAVDRSKARGVKAWCRACDNERSRAYYASNVEKTRDRVWAYQQRNRRPRKCRVCGGLATSQRHHLCDACRVARKRHKWREAEKLRTRGTPTQRGYGSKHKKLREEWARVVASGLATCARCNDPIRVDEPWDLGHDDFDRTKYVGPEHRCCNRATTSHKAQQGVSRSW